MSWDLTLLTTVTDMKLIDGMLLRFSTETVLQVVKFYTVAKKNLKKLTFRTVVLRRSDIGSLRRRPVSIT